MTPILLLAGTVLRQPHVLVSDDPDALAAHAPGLLTLVGAGMALFGVVVGTYRGGLQLAYLPLKTPWLLLVPMALTLPALRPLFDRDGTRITTPRLMLAGLVGIARSALMVAGTAPALWLYLSLRPQYHHAVLAVASTLGLAALPGLWTLVRALAGARPAIGASLLGLVLLASATAQTGWLLRPLVVRPHSEVTFLRPVESDIADALTHTGRSAWGLSSDWEPSSGGALGRRATVRDRGGDTSQPLAGPAHHQATTQPEPHPGVSEAVLLLDATSDPEGQP